MDGTLDNIIIQIGTTILLASGLALAIVVIASQRRELAIRKQTDETVRESEIIVSNSIDMWALLNKHFIYLTANPAYLKAFDKTRDELIGNTVADVFGKDFFEAVIKSHAQRCLKGEEINYQAWFDFPNAGRKYMDIFYYPYLGTGNAVKGFVVSGRDITDRKQADEALRESEEKFRTVFEQSPRGIMRVDLDGKPLEINSVYEKILGYNLDELKNISYADITHPDDLEKENLNVKGLFEGKIDRFALNKRYIRKDGGEIWGHLTVSPVHGQSEAIQEYIAVIEPISLTSILGAGHILLTGTSI